MQEIWIPRIGPPEVLELREAPDPEPGPGEIRVRVQAAGVNFADLLARMGLYPDAPKLPAVIGYEVAGVVDALGSGVAEPSPGTPVVCLTRFGGYRSRVVVPAAQAAVRPAGLDAAHAAAIPVNGLTAWMILYEMGRLREGDRVLVHSAGGGVGLAALDLIRARGAVAEGLAGATKHAWLRERGYAFLADSRREDWDAAFRGRPPFDLILDASGGRSWSRSLRLLRPGGRLAVFGFSANAAGRRRSLLRALRNLVFGISLRDFHPITLMNRNRGVLGVNLGRLWGEGQRVAGWLGELLGMAAAGSLRPVVHARVPFSRAAEAHRILHDRENLGKVVLVPDEETGDGGESAA